MRPPVEASVFDEVQLISISAFAVLVGDLNHFTVRRWIKDGRLRSVKLGGRRLIPVSELQRVCTSGLSQEVQAI